MSKLANNIGWLSLEKIVRALVGTVITIYVANQIGTYNFGIYSLILSIFGISLVISSMGIKSVIIKYFVTDEHNNTQLVLGGIIILFFGSSLISVLSIILLFFTDYFIGYELLLVIYIFAFYANVISIFNFWFESKKIHKFNVFAGLASFIFFSIFKVLCIYFDLNIIYLFASIGLEFILQAIIIIFIFYKRNKENFLQKINKGKIRFGFNKILILNLFKESLPYWITASIVMINIRIDQYLLAYMLSVESVAIYSIAARFAEFLWIIPVIICSSIFPILIDLYDKSEKKEFYEYIKNILGFLYIIAFILSIFLFASSGIIIDSFFGLEYKESAIVMSILAFSIIPLALGSVGSQYIVIKKFGIHNIYRSLVALTTNVLFNIVLIPNYGTIGAAIALLISQFSSSFLIDLFFLQTRKLFFLKLYTLNPIYSFKRFYRFIFINKELLRF